MSSQRLQINGLVYASDAHRVIGVERVLERSRRIGELEVVHDRHALQHQLEMLDYAFVVLVLDEAGERLPSIFRRFSDLPLLVLTAQGDTTPLPNWLQQGAWQAVAADDWDAIEHATVMLIDRCLSGKRLVEAERQIRMSAELRARLFDASPHPLMLFSSGGENLLNARALALLQESLSEGKAHDTPFLRWSGVDTDEDIDLPTLIPLVEYGPELPERRQSTPALPATTPDGALDGRTLASWITRWLAPKYGSLLRDLERGETPPTEVVCRHGKRYRLRTERIGEVPEHAWLMTFALAESGSSLPALETDATTGLPVRASTAALAQEFLDATSPYERHTAFLISLPSIRVDEGGSGIDRTIEDLMAFRAASRLGLLYDESTVVGRTSLRQILVLTRDARATSRRHARRIHRALGTLGGLIERSTEIRVDTLTLIGQSWTAAQLMERLESIAAVAESVEQQSLRDDDDSDDTATLGLGTLR
ncbi:MAG: hypothetical protein CSB44_06790 [Gammaproteobacteria bacterium]|nr:MAG: hypothetical protein CSB44_06790 [Gammaproteobacteria bacterium]